MATIEIEAATEAAIIAVDPQAKNEAVACEAKPKKAKAKKASSPRKSSTHPPFYEMVSDAIATLKEKSGSSQYAIHKFAEEKHKQLPPNFRKMLLVQLRRLVSSGKLVKVKNSFKLPTTTAPAAKKSVANKAVSKVTEKPKAKAKAAKIAAKPKSAAVKPNEKTAKAAKTPAVSSPSSKKAPKKAVAKPKKMKRLSAVKSPAMKKAAASPAKKAIATAKKIKKVSAVKSPAKRMPARKVAK